MHGPSGPRAPKPYRIEKGLINARPPHTIYRKRKCPPPGTRLNHRQKSGNIASRLDDAKDIRGPYRIPSPRHAYLARFCQLYSDDAYAAVSFVLRKAVDVPLALAMVSAAKAAHAPEHHTISVPIISRCRGLLEVRALALRSSHATILASRPFRYLCMNRYAAALPTHAVVA